MKTFNKFLVILLAVAGIFFWLTTISIAWLLPVELSTALRGTAILIRSNILLFQGLITAFGVSSLLVSLLILAGEVSEHEPSVLRLPSFTGGTAFIPFEAVVQALRSDLELVPQVQTALPHIRNARNAIEVFVDLRTDPDTHLPTKAEEVCRTVRETAEKRLGIPVKDVKVNIQYALRAKDVSAAPRQEADHTDPQEILVPPAFAVPESVTGPGELPDAPRS